MLVIFHKNRWDGGRPSKAEYEGGTVTPSRPRDGIEPIPDLLIRLERNPAAAVYDPAACTNELPVMQIRLGSRRRCRRRTIGTCFLIVSPLRGSMIEADRVQIRYSPGSDDVEDSLRAESFEQFLRRSRKGRVAVGDEWEEIINHGCGRTRNVTLYIEAVDGGIVVGSGTDFKFRSETEE